MKSEIIQQENQGIPGLVGPLKERSLVTEWEEISIDSFSKIFKKKAGSLWSRSKNIFSEYGGVLSVEACSCLMYAQEADKLEQYLEKMEAHFKDDLYYQHPEIRGRLIISPVAKNRSSIFVENLIRELRPDLF